MAETYYHPHDLPRFPEMGKQRPDLWEKFLEYYNAVFVEGALTAREKALIALGVAHAVQRGYLIEATVCEGGRSIWVAVQTDEPSYTFTDEQSCSGESGGQLYAVDKHGYTDPVEIPWP